ncbi:hypothetical protein [Acidocella aromatica]|uniref:Phasin domain-containing protein n=1 Tax=Acidocella aromatica TaxID=1303579 RepID=A0A840VC11_9PROT|nr:hypothetical protein [Acidocella aromatica]MBB5372377.1 hypothetical protein [Acidocella aromatica]
MHQSQVTPRGFEQAIAAFNTEGIMDGWRERTVRVLRAQERMMQGMAATARLELRFGQECIFNRLGLFNGGWAEPGNASQQWAEEMGKFIDVIHEINEELRASFTDAGKLLNGDGAAEASEKSVSAAKRTKISVHEEAEKTTA